MSAPLTRRQLLVRGVGLAGGLLLGRAIRLGALPAAAGVARPILAVHGFAAQTEIWSRQGNALTNRLTEAGFSLPSSLVPFRYPVLAGQPELEDSQGDIAAAGLLLAETIRALARRVPSGQVDLLGFSMGGLVSRWAIGYLRETAGGTRPLVNTAVLVGTPNNGADVLPPLAAMNERAQVTILGLARDLADLDLESVAAQQMQPGSPFLEQLNDPARVDGRVRYVLIAGQARLRLQIGQILATVDLGDGLISAASAGYLPGVGSRLYLLPELIAGDGSAAWEALRQSMVVHSGLMFNDDVGLAVAAELAPESASLQRELEARLAGGTLARARG